MDEQLFTNNKLIKIKDNINSLLDYDSYRYKASNIRATQMQIGAITLINNLKDEFKDIPLTEYSLHQINDLSDTLNIKYTQKSFKNIPKGFINARLGIWQLIKNEFNSFQTYLSQTLLEYSNNTIVKHPTNPLNSFQVALLILHLKDSKIINPKIKDIIITDYFEKLTGYSKYNLRNLITGTNKKERNLITEQEKNYNELISVLEDIIKDIKTQKSKFKLK